MRGNVFGSSCPQMKSYGHLFMKQTVTEFLRCLGCGLMADKTDIWSLPSWRLWGEGRSKNKYVITHCNKQKRGVSTRWQRKLAIRPSCNFSSLQKHQRHRSTAPLIVLLMCFQISSNYVHLTFPCSECSNPFDKRALLLPPRNRWVMHRRASPRAALRDHQRLTASSRQAALLGARGRKDCPGCIRLFNATYTSTHPGEPQLPRWVLSNAEEEKRVLFQEWQNLEFIFGFLSCPSRTPSSSVATFSVTGKNNPTISSERLLSCP